MKSFLLQGLVVLLLSGATFAVPVTALTVSGGILSSNTFTWGYLFSLSQNVTITSLGVFDDAGDGMAQAQNVAIWDSGGTMVLQGVVAAGSSDPLIDGFRFTSALTGSTSFAAGTYTIGTQRIGSGTVNASFRGVVSTVSGVNFLGTVDNGSSTVFSQPTFGNQNAMIGPSFQIDDPTPAPELSPGGLPITLVMLTCMVLMGQRRQASFHLGQPRE